MFQSLLSFFKKQTLPTSYFAFSNTFRWFNAPAFSYKLTNWLMFYQYTEDRLNIITIRVYSKNWTSLNFNYILGYILIIILLFI